MARALRWIGYLLAGLLVLAMLAAAWIWFASAAALGGTYQGHPEKLQRPSAAQIADAPRQLKVLGCLSCHGEGLRGDLMFSEPNVATIHAPNLTLIAAKATDQQLARAIRQGIGIDGRPLVIMPSAQYSRLDDAEVAALIGTIRGQPKGGKQTPRISVGPLARIGLAIGKLHAQPDEVERYAANMPADLGPRYSRGRKIAMVNCAECHGPSFTGSEVEPGLEAPDLTIAGAYELAQFNTLMRTGVPPDKRKLKLMDDVSRNDFSHFTDQEIEAIHAYLKERAKRAP